MTWLRMCSTCVLINGSHIYKKKKKLYVYVWKMCSHSCATNALWGTLSIAKVEKV